MAEREVTIHDAAVKYCQDQLAIMDGSFADGLRRIGEERYRDMVRKVERTLGDIRAEYDKRNSQQPGGTQ